MKKTFCFIMTAILALSLCACGKSADAPVPTTETVPATKTIPETEAPTEATVPAEDHQAQIDFYGFDPFRFEGARIFHDGRVFTYNAPHGGLEDSEGDELGYLSYDESFPQRELSTDCAELEGWQVVYLSGELTPDALWVYNQEGWPLVFFPQDRYHPADFTWKENDDGTAAISKYYGTEAHVTVPSEIDGRQVTAIGTTVIEGAFSNCPGVVTVTVPEGVQSLNRHTFLNCMRLETVTLPKSLTVVYGSAFANCPALIDIWFQGDAPECPENGPGALFGYGAEGPTIHRPADASGWDSEEWMAYEQVTY